MRERAEQLGLSVSTVVRNVLLNTFDLVEGVVADSAEIARVIQKRQTRPLPAPRAASEEVLGWQRGDSQPERCVPAVQCHPAQGQPRDNRPAGREPAGTFMPCLSGRSDG